MDGVWVAHEQPRLCGVCTFVLLLVYALVQGGLTHDRVFSARNEELGFSLWRVCILGQFCYMAGVVCE